MKGQKIISCTVFILIGYALFFSRPHTNAAELKEYGIDDVSRVKMSFRYDGAESPYRYAQAEIRGDGETLCSFQYAGAASPQASNLRLKQSVVERFISEYAKLKFLDYDFKKMTDSSDSEHSIYDAGTQTLGFQDQKRSRTITYQVIKTKSVGSLAVPINEDAQVLARLQDMYWSIVHHKEYLSKLKNYQNMDKGELAECILGAVPDTTGIFDKKEFVPIIMEIISQKQMRDSIGQYAAETLEKITGQKLPGDWWDCEKWLRWWEKNKDAYEKN